MSPNNLRNEFKQLFGDQPNGCEDDERLNEVVHCKTSPRIVELCQVTLNLKKPELYDYFKLWDEIGAELTRRRFLSDGLTLLVLDISHLLGQDRELRGLHDALFDDYQRLVFGRIVGQE